MEADHDVFENGHFAEQFNALKCAYHAESCELLRWKPGYIFPFIKYLTGCRAIDTRYDVKQGCFAGSVWTNDTHNLARHNAKGDILQSRKASEYLGHSLYSQHLKEIPLTPLFQGGKLDMSNLQTPYSTFLKRAAEVTLASRDLARSGTPRTRPPGINMVMTIRVIP